MKINYLILFLTIFNSLLVFAADNLSLRKGTSWTYEGECRWIEPKDSLLEKGKVKWKVEVVELEKSTDKTTTIAQLKGSLIDLMNYNNSKKPDDFFLIIKNNKYYMIKGKNRSMQSVVYGVNNDTDIYLDQQAELWFDGNLKKTNTYPKNTNALNNKQNTAGYQWLITNDKNATLNKVKGWDANKSCRQTDAEFNTMEEAITITFTEGIGFTSFKYNFYKTFVETNIELIEYSY